MYQPSDETRINVATRSVAERTMLRVQTLALYGSLALIAAVVFGSLSIHPF